MSIVFICFPMMWPYVSPWHLLWMWHPKASHVHLRSNIRARWKRAQPVLGAMDPRHRSSEGLSIILVSIDF